MLFKHSFKSYATLILCHSSFTEENDSKGLLGIDKCGIHKKVPGIYYSSKAKPDSFSSTAILLADGKLYIALTS